MAYGQPQSCLGVRGEVGPRVNEASARQPHLTETPGTETRSRGGWAIKW